VITDHCTRLIRFLAYIIIISIIIIIITRSSSSSSSSQLDASLPRVIVSEHEMFTRSCSVVTVSCEFRQANQLTAPVQSSLDEAHLSTSEVRRLSTLLKRVNVIGQRTVSRDV